MMKNSSIVAAAGKTAAVLATAAALELAVSSGLFHLALDTQSPIFMGKLQNLAAKAQGGKKNGNDMQYSGFCGTPEIRQWYRANRSRLFLTSQDGLALHAYYLENPRADGKAAVLCHGYTSSGEHMANYAKHYFDMGYSVLIPDARAHGHSAGRYVGMGWPERLDLIQWTNELIRRSSAEKIVLHGVSMGGATVMMAAGEESLPAQVRAIVEDCGYSSVYEEFRFQLKKMFHLPAFPLLDTASCINRRHNPYGFRQASAAEQVRKSRTPILFIHGEKDEFVPFSMMQEVCDAAGSKKEKLAVPNAVHAAASLSAPELYWSAVEKFVKKHAGA